MINKKNTNIIRKPNWLKIKLPEVKDYTRIKNIVKEHNLHTICSSGNCPNVGECWGMGTATFMILGDICTRACKFCAVKTGKPNPVDRNEPQNIAKSIKLMKLKHCVITSVDRDDLADGGSILWSETIAAVKKENPDTTIEVLIPDFQGNYENLKRVIETKPEVISHNLETVKRLTPNIRSKAKYEISLKVLKWISEAEITSKSGIMLGLGEKEEEIIQTMDDLIQVNCKVLTLGQYLQPTKNHAEVINYITPEKFEEYRLIGLKKGFKFVESSPLVRSSYHADKHVGA
ncbi:MAG: lipoyl synthase [Bacteroidales bacterium]|nr:lipoyl synthase [Bacteroidales bacterium]